MSETHSGHAAHEPEPRSQPRVPSCPQWQHWPGLEAGAAASELEVPLQGEATLGTAGLRNPQMVFRDKRASQQGSDSGLSLEPTVLAPCF